MATNIVGKSYNIPVSWDGRRYSDQDAVPSFTAPSGLSASPSSSTNTVSWTNGTPSAQTVVYRSLSSTDGFAAIATVSAGATSYDDTGLANGTYYYKAAHTLNSLFSAETSVASGIIASSTGGRTITGSGFGSEPTIVLFDRATGTDGAAYSLSRDVGTYDHFANSTGENEDVRYITHAGRTWMAGRQISTVASNVKELGVPWFITASKYTEYYIEYRFVIPTGFCFPGASPNVNSKTWTQNVSRWKLAWAWNSSYPATTTTDCVFGNLGGSIAVQGNGMQPRYGSDASSQLIYFSTSGLSAVEENLMGCYLKIGATDTSWDGIVETLQANGASVTRNVRTNARPFHGPTSQLPETGHDTFLFNSWSGNVDQSNVQHGWADMYLAVGANSRARVYSHNAPTLAASTQIQNITACKTAWSDTSITLSGMVNPRETLPYMSVISGTGTLHENVSWS